MSVTCASCGNEFQAQRSTSKFCSGKCRKRAADLRKRTGQVVQFAPKSQRPAPVDSDRALVASLRESFKEADLASPAGQIALRLCADVDALAPGTPGYGPIVAQMRAAVDDLRTYAKPKAATPLTLLRERRAADRAASTG
jgi:hypothetical protein